MNEPKLRALAKKGRYRKYTLAWALSTALHCLGEILVKLSLHSAKIGR